MKYFFLIGFCVLSLISCGKTPVFEKVSLENTSSSENLQQQTSTQTSSESTGAISLSGNNGVEQKIEVVLPEGEVSAIHVNIPKGFALKNAVVDRPKDLAVKQNDAGILGKLGFSFSSPTQEEASLETMQNQTQASSTKDSSISTNAGNTLENSSSQTSSSPQTVEKPKTLLSRILSIIPGYPKQDTTILLQNTNLQTPVSTVTQSQNPTGTSTQTVNTQLSQETTNSQQDVVTNQNDTSEETTQTGANEEQSTITTQTGSTQVNPTVGTDISEQTNTSTSSDTQQEPEGQEQTQISEQVQIIDTNLPDLSKYPITSQSGSVYVFEDSERQMGIVISLHNRGNYGTAAELINPTLYYLGELSRQDLEPGVLNNSHAYPKFDVQAEGNFDGTQRIFYLRFYDFGPILVYIGVYTTPEKFEENDPTMKTIIDTFLWNEEY